MQQQVGCSAELALEGRGRGRLAGAGRANDETMSVQRGKRPVHHDDASPRPLSSPHLQLQPLCKRKTEDTRVFVEEDEGALDRTVYLVPQAAALHAHQSPNDRPPVPSRARRRRRAGHLLLVDHPIPTPTTPDDRHKLASPRGSIEHRCAIGHIAPIAANTSAIHTTNTLCACSHRTITRLPSTIVKLGASARRSRVAASL